MGQFILDGIQFTADNSTLSTAGKKTTKFGNNANANFPQQIIDKVGVKPFVNAVEIDWNGAQLGDKEINTTGELLSYISGVANNIPEVPADVITESKLSAKGYLTSSDLDVSYQNVRDWVNTNFVEKPTVTKILAGVLTTNEKLDISSSNSYYFINLIKDKIVVNLRKEYWYYTQPFNSAYVSTNNKEVDDNFYGTIKCTTKDAGYLYLVTVKPIYSTIMGDLTAASSISDFTYISSNTLPAAIPFNNKNDIKNVEFYANNNQVWLTKDDSKAYFIHAEITIADCDVYISQGTLLNIYTSFTPDAAPTPTPTVTTTPTATVTPQ